ncbi:Epidermis-specific secreted glycoprotein EP1 [Hibiscus syriacus]|uniref:Epidermis-specific secreted glycoprotein EP1 n=1 Tax=Hibiscus syriacus TaxID=106335 RepID=A0A6A3CWB7_HIBSY|nr:epidermis-specific secreted glycoprotein EP1-like [Hibiscus syriacus]KAE8733643.1 Epidermis-specific secreted glycoprotein EP1 [Hibiscus syriacus]
MAKMFTSPSLVISLFLFCFNALATVPPSATFKHVNNGEFGPFVVEYLGNYRVISIANAPFQLAFYNTTPDAFTLGLRMASTRSESLFRWVWEANRGNPVRENATFSLGADGNLVLADADGRIAWQSNTANRGVVGFKLLSNGNMVLHDSKGKFIWQSFDHPTDTLLVGQSLRVGGPTKLVSRASVRNNVNGAYSLVMETKGLVLQYKGLNSPKPLVYFKSSVWPSTEDGTLQYVTLNVEPDTHEGFAYNIVLDYTVAKSSSSGTGNLILARPKYNSTLSILRLDIDGNLRIFTYNDKVDSRAWEETFTLFSRDSIWGTECELPERRGNFGVCEENQCVACPSPKGLLGWNKNCEPKKVSSCRPNDFRYYKLEGVEHFMSRYNEGQGPIKETDCGKKCTVDCKCLGYFYHRETAKCWVANELKTLAKASNASHVGYIKAPKK